MAQVSAALVKELRERTSAGMMDCKKALEECDADIEKSIDWLRQKGLSKAAKKAGRATTEGIIARKANDNNSTVAIVEVKCETDFVARGEQFQQFAASMADRVFAAKPADDASLQAIVGDDVNQLIGTLGENMSVGRFCVMQANGAGVVGSYIHSNSKIGVLVEVGCKKAETAQKPELLELAKNIAMQVAAANALALDENSLDPAAVEREREVFRQKTLDEGKPANIVEKIVEGRIKKFYQEVCLLNQAYIRDDTLTIKELVAKEGKALGDELNVARFVCFRLGEDAPAQEA